MSLSLTSILPLLNIVSKIPDQSLGAIIEMAKSWYCYRRAQESGVFPGFQTAELLSGGTTQRTDKHFRKIGHKFGTFFMRRPPIQMRMFLVAADFRNFV